MVAPFFLPRLKLAVSDREAPTGSFATLQLNADSRGRSVYRCYPPVNEKTKRATRASSHIYTYLRRRRRLGGGTVNINKRAQSPLVGRFYRFVSSFSSFRFFFSAGYYGRLLVYTFPRSLCTVSCGRPTDSLG